MLRTILISVFLVGCNVETNAERNTRIIIEVKRCQSAGLGARIYWSLKQVVECTMSENRNKEKAIENE